MGLVIYGCSMLAVAVGTTHGIFNEQRGLDFNLLAKIRSAVKPPVVLRGAWGISMMDSSKAVKAGMSKINFGESLRCAPIEREAP